MRRQQILIFLAGFLALCLLSLIVYNLPPIHERLAWRVDNLRVKVQRYFNPPEEAVFVPQEQVEAIVGATLTALAETPTQTPLPGPTATPLATLTPSLTPTPIPASASLTGIRHEYQKFNNCAPASLSMVLSYWGWTGDQIQTRAYLRPSFEIDDKNVNAWEIAEFVEQQTDFEALWRVGGDLATLKRLLAAGFPVLIEKGLDPHDDAWMGHYQIINGYDDAKAQFRVYDSYEGPPESYGVPYETIAQFWRHFNFTYVVIYPPERLAEVQSILGPSSNPQVNFQAAAQLASTEANSLTGGEQFFAWYNLGTNLVYLQDYAGAAQAYDNAFAIYAALPVDERPWRILWYQEGPYTAYYYTGRYQDVISLAGTALVTVDKPVLEETYYWRGMAKAALGDKAGAIEDLNRAFTLNPRSTQAGEELQRLNSQ